MYRTQVNELWGSGAKRNAERQEDVGDKILGVLAGDKGKQQKQKEAQKDWFASKVSGGNAFFSAAIFIAFQVNEMAGGGQAGELKEDKLDKGTQVLLSWGK